MKTQGIGLALAIVLLCTFASAQSVQTSGTKDLQNRHLPVIDTNAFQETPRELLGLPAQHRMQADFIGRIDSLRAKQMQLLFPEAAFTPNGVQRSLRSHLRLTSSRSPIDVIDTAFVRSTIDTTRHLYSFNANVKRTSDVTQKLNGGIWVDTLRETNTYDASGNMLSDLLEGWSNGQWVSINRTTLTYDPYGNVLSELSEQCSNGQWMNGTRKTYTYGANEHLLSDLIEAWDGGSWLKYGCYTYSYDANGNILSDAYVFWSLDQLAYYPWRNTFTYDENGHILTELHEVGGLLWRFVNDNRWTYTYDSAWNILSKLNEYWLNGQWVYGQRYTYTYDAEGSMLFWITELWSNGQWVNGSRNTYTYDSIGNLLLLLGENWTNNQWMNSERYTYTYDAEENLTSLWHYGWLNSSWTSTDIGEGGGFGVSDSAGNTYDLGYGYNCTLIRKLIVTGVASQSGNVPTVYSLSQNYPNPFNPSTAIKFDMPRASQVNLSVFDILGREVSVLVNDRRDAGVYEVKFDGSNLASGVYFYRLQAGDFVQAKKLLILR
jgi:hypothetical protein